MDNVVDTVDLTWENVEFCVEAIAKKVRGSGFVPDYLVGISLGGLIPLALLAEELDIRNIVTFSAMSYQGTRRGYLQITYRPTVNLRGKNVLLVDEIADSGNTLFTIAEELTEDYRVGELKTAVLAINKEHCIKRPDFFSIEDSRWIVFPWEESPNT